MRNPARTGWRLFVEDACLKEVVGMGLFGKRYPVICRRCAREVPPLPRGTTIIGFGRCRECGEVFCDRCAQIVEDVSFCPKDGSFLEPIVQR